MARRTSDDGEYPPIADYGLLGDIHSCALVSKAGSIDWACFPRFDSPAVFGRLLHWDNGGYFQLAPLGVKSVSRRYLPETNILESTFETDSGTARLIDFMPVHPHSRPEQPREVGGRQEIVRNLECTSGSVTVAFECHPRFDYGTIVPHVELSALRRSAGRGDHIAPRSNRRRAELGLSLHLDTRCHLRALRALHSGLSRGRRGVQGLAGVEHRGPFARSPADVRPRWGAPAH